MNRILSFAYGVFCYVSFLGVFLYAIGFIGNFLVPRSLDSAPLTSFGTALITNLALLALFAIQHSGMARPTFKKWWTRFVPEPIERSTYVLFSNVAMVVLFAAWQPMGGTVWNIGSDAGRIALYTLFAAGWLLVLVSTFLINHFDLFGLRQVWLHLRGKEYTALRFVTPGPYKIVRHPLYVGWLCVAWATPTMTISHLVFSVMVTGYILVAIQLEERNLEESLGDYAGYKSQVPMLVPSFARR